MHLQDLTLQSDLSTEDMEARVKARALAKAAKAEDALRKKERRLAEKKLRFAKKF